METRVDKVAEKHKSGYNCAQAVACAYCDLVGIDEETMFRMTEGLGLGMGGMEGTCGAVTAACVIAGAKNSTVEMGGPGSKGATYKISKEIVRKMQPAYWKRLYLASRKVTCPLEAAYNKRKR